MSHPRMLTTYRYKVMPLQSLVAEKWFCIFFAAFLAKLSPVHPHCRYGTHTQIRVECGIMANVFIHTICEWCTGNVCCEFCTQKYASVLFSLQWSALAPRTTILLLSIQPDPIPPPPGPLALLCTPDQLVSCTENEYEAVYNLTVSNECPLLTE